MPKILMKKAGILSKEAHQLHDIIMELGMSVERKDSIQMDDMVFSVYEKYYMRSENYTSLSIVLRQVDKDVLLSAISAAGGGGFLNISWGAEESFLTSFEKQCYALHYQKVV